LLLAVGEVISKMTPPQIIGKLEKLLAEGIRTEAEATYLMVAVRKTLEQHSLINSAEYESLTFHCNWALHSVLDRGAAQRILKLFEAASIDLRAGKELHELPESLDKQLTRIITFDYFEEQLDKFLKANSLPSLRVDRSNGWLHFMQLYAKVVENSPLVMNAQDHSATIARVTLNLESATAPKDGQMWFKVSWIIEDKDGKKGEIYVLNSFAVSRSNS
jgi:hypothetical protein